MIFHDRREAGRRLAEKLAWLKGEPNVVVLGIPRGGVLVAAEIADALGAPLDVFLARKIGAPFNPELAMGAVTESGPVFLDQALIDQLRLDPAEIQQEIAAQRTEIARRLTQFRGSRPPLDVKGKTVVVVDDGVATGSTMLAALRALRALGPARLILAIPVGPPDVVRMLAEECDRACVLDTPEPFWAVGRFYENFNQTEDAEVVRVMEAAAGRVR